MSFDALKVAQSCLRRWEEVRQNVPMTSYVRWGWQTQELKFCHKLPFGLSKFFIFILFIFTYSCLQCVCFFKNIISTMFGGSISFYFEYELRLVAPSWHVQVPGDWLPSSQFLGWLGWLGDHGIILQVEVESDINEFRGSCLSVAKDLITTDHNWENKWYMQCAGVYCSGL